MHDITVPRLGPLEAGHRNVREEKMSGNRVTTCRELGELEEDDCCSTCHADTATGHDRLELVRLDDGRLVRLCHAAEKVLRERGLLTGPGSGAWPTDPHE